MSCMETTRGELSVSHEGSLRFLMIRLMILQTRFWALKDPSSVLHVGHFSAPTAPQRSQSRFSLEHDLGNILTEIEKNTSTTNC
jgi:hypothetical protein